MLSLIQKDDLNLYLESSPAVDYNIPEIQEKARELSGGLDQVPMVENIYNFVRDEIHHSMDLGKDLVTCRASDVLREGHGLCFAKSNLLAALLRFKGIPTGFCYQRLVHEDDFILHGLNAVYMGDEWFRLDARGNHEGINAQFSMGQEKLAFQTYEAGEEDYTIIYSEPDSSVIHALCHSKDVQEVMHRIPKSINIKKVHKELND